MNIKSIQELKGGDVVYLHPPSTDSIMDRYSRDDFYNTLGIVSHTPALHQIYARIKIKDDDYDHLYHSFEITKIGEL